MPPTAVTQLEQIVAFLNSIGVATRQGVVPGDAFLPGIRVTRGALVYDPPTLRWPGDLLHEAGHIATTPAALRGTLDGGIELPGDVGHATEAEVSAWAYAAACHLQLDPAVVFHGGGYQGAAPALVATFALGVYPGAPGLAAAGMTHVGAAARAAGLSVYPRMVRWLRA